MVKKAAAEFLGTFWLVLGGCGSAVLAAAFPGLGIGFAGVALAFGLTVLTMAFAIGHISGLPPQSGRVGRPLGRRPFPRHGPPPVHRGPGAGAIAAAGVLYLIASGKAGFDLAGGFASNGYGEHSPGRVRARRRPRHRGGHDLHVPHDHPRAPPTSVRPRASRPSPSASA